MSEQRRVFLLILVMTVIAISVVGIALFTLYQSAKEQQIGRLLETARSQARLMEVVAEFDQRYAGTAPGDALATTLEQIRDMHGRFKAYGKTSEFLLGKREGDKIVFLLSHRSSRQEKPGSVDFFGKLAKPMRRALSGKSGTLIGLDYRGKTVLAAYEPVAVLKVGIVAKIDLAEIRTPFIKATWLSCTIALAFMLLSMAVLWRIGTPLIRRLKESEKKYHAIVDSAGEGVFTIDEKGILTSFNKAAQRIFGYTEPEVFGRNVNTLIAEPCCNKHDSFLKSYLCASEENAASFERDVTGKRKDGSTFPVELAVSEGCLGQLRIFTGIVRDITKRKLAEDKLKRREAQLAEAQRIAHIGSWEHDINIHEVRWSEELYHILRLSPERYKPDEQSLLRLVAEEDRENVRKAVKTAMSRGECCTIECHVALHNGSLRFVRAEVRVECNHYGKPRRLSGTVQDITHIKRAEEALKESEARYRRLVENT
ncbi:MAG: PAS domain S-box protein, partial [Gammaproteobacteria bacterium]|nr:PAS domain S-box protein [Gammaproteobacteria bacterium]